MKRITRFIGRIFRDVKNKGLISAFKYYTYAMTPRDFIVFSINPGKCPDCVVQCDDLTFRRITIDALKSIRDRIGNLPQEFYCDLLYGFTTPFIMEEKGEVAAIHWLVMPGEWSKFMVLKEGEAELNYNIVLPKFRGKRLAEKLMRHILQSLKDEGDVKTVYGVVASSNIAQFKQMVSMGFMPVGVITKFFWTNDKYVTP